MMFGKLICLVLGHRRGKRLTTHTGGIPLGCDKFQCPRCHSTWTRKKKVDVHAQ